MDWILNALANAILEAQNDILHWTTKIMTGFNLTIGMTGPMPKSDTADFTIFDITGFQRPLMVLAMFIVIMSSVLKLYQSMAGPFTQSEEPHVIALRTILAGCGVMFSYKIFVMIEMGFNRIYQQFVDVYTGLAQDYNSGKWLPSEDAKKAASDAAKNATPGSYKVDFNHTPGSATDAIKNANDNGVFNLFGGDKLIKGLDDPGLGLIIIEVIIGCTLLICLFKLVLECYERYVLIGVMYLTAPLAFSTLVSKQSQIFKNWLQMIVSQFILMCTNLIFIGGFMGAWFHLFNGVQDRQYVFSNEQEYLTTMFLMIGWLLAGQKMDEHLRSLGLSAAQTGSGIMGAMMGGAALAAGAFRTASGVARSAGNTMHNAATGQTKIQKAVQAGKEGRGGGIYGEMFGQNSQNKAAKETRQANQDARQAKQDARQATQDARNDAKWADYEGQKAQAAERQAAAAEHQAALEVPMNQIPSGNNFDSGTNLEENAKAAASAAGLGEMNGLGETYNIGGAEFQTMKSADGKSQIDIAKNDAAASMLNEHYGSKTDLNSAKAMVSVADSSGNKHVAAVSYKGSSIQDKVNNANSPRPAGNPNAGKPIRATRTTKKKNK